MSGLTPRGALRIGDRVRFGGGVHQVAGIEGTTVRLVPEDGLPWLAAVCPLGKGQQVQWLLRAAVQGRAKESNE